MNPEAPSNIQGVIARLCLPCSLREASVEERYIVSFVSADPTAHFVPGNNSNPEHWLADDQDWLIALIVPQVSPAEFPATNL